MKLRQLTTNNNLRKLSPKALKSSLQQSIYKTIQGCFLFNTYSKQRKCCEQTCTLCCAVGREKVVEKRPERFVIVISVHLLSFHFVILTEQRKIVKFTSLPNYFLKILVGVCKSDYLPKLHSRYKLISFANVMISIRNMLYRGVNQETSRIFQSHRTNRNRCSLRKMSSNSDDNQERHLPFLMNYSVRPSPNFLHTFKNFIFAKVAYESIICNLLEREYNNFKNLN